jgi:glycosyltransferase involved in cell wall biosynthesis
VLSDHAADQYRQSVGGEVRVIHPGVDLRRFAPADARAEQPTIVCPAAVEEPRKNVALLLDAFALVREREPEARLVLSRPRDPRALARAGIEIEAPGVQWRDLDDERLLARVYGEAWVAVLPAVDEAFGLVLVEALACGTPVVGYAGGGIPEIVDRDDTGRLFDRLEPDALAAALTEMLATAGDPATAARCRAHGSRFSTDLCTERYLALYRELGSAR